MIVTYPYNLILPGLALWCGLVACAPAEKAQAISPDTRIVAVGDLHGDLKAARQALQLAGAIDSQDNWQGGNMVLVQTGDQIDRGDDDLAILDLFEKLTAQAEKAGGQVHALNGNHEVMNAQGDFRYVTLGGFQAFDRVQHLDVNRASLSQLPLPARHRAAAFQPGGPYALKLAQHKVILTLGDTVFVHGGVLPEHVDYGIERLNKGYQDWLTGVNAQLPPALTDQRSPIWTRLYSAPGQAPDCTALVSALKKLGAKRMVVGHSVQPTINSACEDKVWRIDVGMSKAYGGPIQALEIKDQQVKILTASPQKVKVPAR